MNCSMQIVRVARDFNLIIVVSKAFEVFISMVRCFCSLLSGKVAFNLGDLEVFLILALCYNN